MLKMIIVDDERLIRNGLTDYLDWAAMGIEISAVCANGMEALQAIRAHGPNIVLTDIAMPVMDGVELLKKARSEGFGGQFIFISSYSEFRYAQEALKYGAFDYLLKPLEAAALEDSVRRCMDVIRANPTPVQNGWDCALACDLLHGALSGLPRAAESFLGLLKRAVPSYSSPVMAVCVSRGNLSLSVLQQHYALCCSLPRQCVVVILPDAAALAPLKALDSEALWHARPCTGDLHLLLCRILLSLWLDCHDAMEEASPPLSQAAWLKDLRHAADLALSSSMNLNACWILCRETLNTLCMQIERIAPVKAKKTTEALNAAQVYDLFECTYQTGLQLLASNITADSLAPYARKAIAMIEEHYGENLSLGMAARCLGISKSHLSATFKADMGCTFSDYLYACRMKAAKKLLEEGNHKIYEIAEKVGYPDLAQFSKRFKQYYGISPRDMQKRF